MRYSTLNIVWNPLGSNPDPNNRYGLLGKDCSKCQSPSLRLEKYVRLGKDDKGKTVKKDEIEAVVNSHKEHAKPIPVFEPKGAVPLVAKLRSRLIVNQAGGIRENAGLCLHPHFGAPYIPGSAVKGIARHAAWCQWKEAKDAGNETEVNKIAQAIAKVFGFPTGDKDGLDTYLAEHGWKDKTQSGSIIFLPAVPWKNGAAFKGKLCVDIVNCHQKLYYGNKEKGAVPSATDQPNPQFFPCVDSDVSFRFVLVPTRIANQELVSSAQDWLIEGLEANGAGAKTAAGYGWFDFTEFRMTKEREEREERRQKQEAAKRRANEVRPSLQQFNVEYLDFDKRVKAETLLAEIQSVPDMARYLTQDVAQVRSKIIKSKELDVRKEQEVREKQEQEMRRLEEEAARREKERAAIPPCKEAFEDALDFLVSEFRWFAKRDYAEDRRMQLLELLISRDCPQTVRDGWNMVKSGDNQQIRQITDARGNPFPREVWRGIAASVRTIREFAAAHAKELP